MTYEELTKDNEINEYIKYSDECLKNMGFTEHGFAHVQKVSLTVEYILSELGYSKDIIELGKIASYIHDIGNCVNRNYHSHSGALMSQQLLKERDMLTSDIAKISYAIGNHDETTGIPADAISSALIIADKADIRRSRVRKRDKHEFDIHDKVNYSVISSNLTVDKKAKTILLDVKLDKEYSSVLDYFEIFLKRMILCKTAAKQLNCKFMLNIDE